MTVRSGGGGSARPLSLSARADASPSDVSEPTYRAELVRDANRIARGRSGERTRLKLLAAGVALLGRTSYRDLGVEAISRRAGQAKGTFYLYFDTKDAFL